MIPCTHNFFGMRRCNFEPRYDTLPPEFNQMGLASVKTTVDGMETMIRSLTKQVYVQDICTSCGKVRRRDDAPCGDNDQ